MSSLDIWSSPSWPGLRTDGPFLPGVQQRVPLPAHRSLRPPPGQYRTQRRPVLVISLAFKQPSVSPSHNVGGGLQILEGRGSSSLLSYLCHILGNACSLSKLHVCVCVTLKNIMVCAISSFKCSTRNLAYSLCALTCVFSVLPNYHCAFLCSQYTAAITC